MASNRLPADDADAHRRIDGKAFSLKSCHSPDDNCHSFRMSVNRRFDGVFRCDDSAHLSARAHRRPHHSKSPPAQPRRQMEHCERPIDCAHERQNRQQASVVAKIEELAKWISIFHSAGADAFVVLRKICRFAALHRCYFAFNSSVKIKRVEIRSEIRFQQQ